MVEIGQELETISKFRELDALRQMNTDRYKDTLNEIKEKGRSPELDEKLSEAQNDMLRVGEAWLDFYISIPKP